MPSPTQVGDTITLEIDGREIDIEVETVPDVYENYLRKNGKIGSKESIIEEYPAAITYSGAYLLLKQQKRKAAELKAINSLINHLYCCQYVWKISDSSQPEIDEFE